MAKSCCRSCPRCADCPVLVAAAARARRRDEAAMATMIEDVLIGTPSRRLPDAVVATLETLNVARRAPRRREPAVAA